MNKIGISTLARRANEWINGASNQIERPQVMLPGYYTTQIHLKMCVYWCWHGLRNSLSTPPPFFPHPSLSRPPWRSPSILASVLPFPLAYTEWRQKGKAEEGAIDWRWYPWRQWGRHRSKPRDWLVAVTQLKATLARNRRSASIQEAETISKLSFNETCFANLLRKKKKAVKISTGQRILDEAGLH